MLEEFFNYKNRLAEDLLTSEKIIKLINENVDLETAGSLMYNQVFPVEYVPETTEKAKTFICVDVDIQQTIDKTFLSPVIYIWAFTHKSLLRLDEGGIRTDALCSEICEKINGSRFYGLGELNFYSCKRFAPMTDYQGKTLTFNAKDFNRLHNPNKPIPTNRRLGR